MLGVTIIDLGVAPYALLKVMVTSHVDTVPAESAVTTNDPAESVDPLVTTALGLVPQLAGVLMVGAVV